MAVAVVVADADPWSSRSQTQMAVTTMQRRRTPGEVRRSSRLQGQTTNGANGSSTSALPRYSTPMSWRAGARSVSSLLISGLTGIRQRRQEPEHDRAHGTLRRTCEPLAAWYRARSRSANATGIVKHARSGEREASGERDHHRVHGAAGQARPDGSLGRPEGLHLPQDHRGPRGRPVGRGGDTR